MVKDPATGDQRRDRDQAEALVDVGLEMVKTMQNKIDPIPAPV